jgi:hypothetical protein
MLIRISELDVRITQCPLQVIPFTTEEATKEANRYKYIVKSYMTNIPESAAAWYNGLGS